MRLHIIVLTQNMNLGTIATLPSLAASKIIPKETNSFRALVVNLICGRRHFTCMDLDMDFSENPIYSLCCSISKNTSILGLNRSINAAGKHIL